MAPSSFPTYRSRLGVRPSERRVTPSQRAVKMTATCRLLAANGAGSWLVPAASPPRLVWANGPGRRLAISRMTFSVRLVLPMLRLLTFWILMRMQRPMARPPQPPRSARGWLRQRTSRLTTVVQRMLEPLNPRRRRGASGCQSEGSQHGKQKISYAYKTE